MLMLQLCRRCRAATFSGAIGAGRGGWVTVSPMHGRTTFTGGAAQHGVTPQSTAAANRSFTIVAASGPSKCGTLFHNFGDLDVTTAASQPAYFPMIVDGPGCLYRRVTIPFVRLHDCHGQFKMLGLKVWVSANGGDDWAEFDLTSQHNLRPPLGPAGVPLLMDARVNASVRVRQKDARMIMSSICCVVHHRCKDNVCLHD